MGFEAPDAGQATELAGEECLELLEGLAVGGTDLDVDEDCQSAAERVSSGRRRERRAQCERHLARQRRHQGRHYGHRRRGRLELVDMPPEGLRLTALRQLTLLWVADRVDDPGAGRGRAHRRARGRHPDPGLPSRRTPRVAISRWCCRCRSRSRRGAPEGRRVWEAAYEVHEV
ncbi:hypothetical protein [Streptomyces sp. SD15]